MAARLPAPTIVGSQNPQKVAANLGVLLTANKQKRPNLGPKQMARAHANLCIPHKKFLFSRQKQLTLNFPLLFTIFILILSGNPTNPTFSTFSKDQFPASKLHPIFPLRHFSEAFKNPKIEGCTIFMQQVVVCKCKPSPFVLPAAQMLGNKI